MTEPIEAWLCPCHGIVDEGDLLEGRDPAGANANDPDGWTDQFYCPRCPDADPCEVTHTRLVPLSRALQAEAERDRANQRAEGERQIAQGYAKSASLVYRDQLEEEIRALKVARAQAFARAEAAEARLARVEEALRHFRAEVLEVAALIAMGDDRSNDAPKLRLLADQARSVLSDASIQEEG